MNVRLIILITALIQVLIPHPAQACIWDADTLSDEKKHSPKMAEVILGAATKPVDPDPLRSRIDALKREPRENDPAWWNDLAGAHLRLGEASAAAKLLEPVMAKFPNNYGLHANLGTAYHLLGRYVDAEREIARDLELNPDGHFGLEKYHLALLQYLSRDAEYQKQHVYVDEWSEVFFDHSEVFLSQPHVLSPEDSDVPRPAYRKLWNLAEGPKFTDGILYMATLNPKQPACFVMLGIASQQNRDLNLAIKAYERAMNLGSPQAEILRQHMTAIHKHIAEAGGHSREALLPLLGLAIAAALAVGAYALSVRKRRRALRA